MKVLQWLVAGCACLAITTATGYTDCKSMATFNTGLVNSVGNQSSRLPLIIEALQQSQDDFICVQEVWWEADMTSILEGVESQFPHHWSKIHAAEDHLRNAVDECQEVKDVPCTGVEAGLLVQGSLVCGMEKGCFNLSTTVEQGICLVTRCPDIFKHPSIREACVTCAFLQSPLILNEALRECVTPQQDHNRVNQPGLLILSKQRLNSVSYKEFFPGRRTPLERGYIEAELDDGKLAVCTHLTAIFPFYLEFDVLFSSYAEQSAAEIEILGETFSGRRHILLGDFNTGPTVTNKPGEKNLTGEYPMNYGQLLSYNYRGPYVERDGRCTFCNDNALTKGDPNNVIDQVLVHPPESFATPFAERAFDQDDPPLSDHYGVRADVCDLDL